MSNKCLQSDLKKNTFNYVISLGCACNTSLYLKELNLKTFSLPYDWIFSNLDMIKHTIEDDFKLFSDINLMSDRQEKKASHNYYHQKLFNHRNPRSNREDYDYYQRCIARFKQVINSSDNKLFIHTLYLKPQEFHRDYLKFQRNFQDVAFDLNKIKKFNQFLNSVTSNYTLLVILQNPKQQTSQVKKVLESENLLVYTIDCLGRSSGKLLKNSADHQNYTNIIKQFNFQLKNLAANVSTKV